MIFYKNESKSITGLDTLTVGDVFPSKDREQYILNQLKKIKIGTRLLESIGRDSIIIITKLSNDKYEFNYGNNTSIYSPNTIAADILRDRNSLYNIPNGVIIKPRSRIDYEDDQVKVFDERKQIYEGIEDYEPMKDEDWRYNKNFGLYYLFSYATENPVYYKCKA